MRFFSIYKAIISCTYFATRTENADGLRASSCILYCLFYRVVFPLKYLFLQVLCSTFVGKYPFLKAFLMRFKRFSFFFFFSRTRMEIEAAERVVKRRERLQYHCHVDPIKQHLRLQLYYEIARQLYRQAERYYHTNAWDEAYVIFIMYVSCLFFN
jgi:hypothetical protein